jgi:hypothetical protein
VDQRGDEAARRACEVVRRYLTEALFGGDERALRETVADSELAERAWLFWAAFTDRELSGPDVLFANATGTQVAAHLSATAVQIGQWITTTSPDENVPVTLECTATFILAGDRITGFRETWR